MVFGTFDGIHEGHLDFFKQARHFGDYLIAVVARDKNVKALKKYKPARDEKERLRYLRSCKLVDEAILGGKGDPYKLIKKIKPDVICLGYDQRYFADNLERELKDRKLNIAVYRMKPHKPKKFHSSILNKK